MKRSLFFFLFLTQLLFISVAQKRAVTRLFIGSYTMGLPDSGIYVYEFNVTTGAFKKNSVVKNIMNPSYLSVAPNGSFLYACTDTKTKHAGSITAFAIDSVHGKLTMINKQPSGGENPVYVSVDKTNRFLVSANYTEGNASVFKLDKNGGLEPYPQLLPCSGSSINRQRQEKPHIHAAVFSPDEDYLFLTDLGADKIRSFRFDKTQAEPMTAVESSNTSTTPGSGPRHLTFHPNNKFAYCVEELSGTVSAYLYQQGQLTFIQQVFSYSKKEDAYESADIHVSPDGLFLYASNRGNDNTISIFSIDQTTGMLTLKGHQSTFGDHPRNFAIAPGGRFLLVANASTHNIAIFKRDLKTGSLTRLKEEISLPRPSCLQFRTYLIDATHD